MQVTRHIHALKIPFQVPVGPKVSVERFVYAYLIYGKKIWLVDAGVKGSQRAIFDYIIKTGGKPDKISTLVLTHSHPDHMGAARAVKEATGCEVLAHPGEIEWIEDARLQAEERHVPGFYSLVGGSVQVDRAIEDGEILDLGNGLALEVLHTPGHSKGMVSLVFPEDAALFSADAVPLYGDVPIFDDPAATVESIERLRAIEGMEILLASWDDPRRGGEVKKVMEDGIEWMRRVIDAVAKVAGAEPSLEPGELTGKVLKELGLPEELAVPLVVKSIQGVLNAGAF